MASRVARVWVTHEVLDDGGMLFNVERASNGILTGEVRVYGHVNIDGKEYSYDRNFRVRLTPDKRR